MSDRSAGPDETTNVLHRRSGPGTVWTTVNTAEALPGLLTPLGWTFWEEGMELALHGAFADIGVLGRREVVVHPSVDQRSGTVFFGRYVGNVDTLRRFADRMPGTSGDAWEEQVFGATPSGVTSTPRRRRYPLIAAKMPLAVRRIPRRLDAVRDATDRWWRAAAAIPPRTEAEAARLLAEASARFRDAMQSHVLATFVCQGMFDQVSALAKAAGKPGLELRLTTGYGGLEESLILRDMWEVSRGRLALDGFVSRHGYHGPSEGEISNPSWREDPTLVKPVLELYGSRAEHTSPAALERHQAAERTAAESELLSVASGPLGRARTRFVLRLAARYIPLREVGKAAFLRTIDVGRIAARVLGTECHRRGLIDDPDDIFFFTLTELTRGLPSGTAALVAERRAIRAGYADVQLPQRWVGQPHPARAATPCGAERRTVRGLPVSPGVVEGRVRVVLDPTDLTGFENGDVLVCGFTDPSWAPLLNLAGALVIDIGGPMSHGAIVARELGIPAVINTGTGTSVLHSGDAVRVDATAGTVEILDRAREPVDGAGRS